MPTAELVNSRSNGAASSSALRLVVATTVDASSDGGDFSSRRNSFPSDQRQAVHSIVSTRWLRIVVEENNVDASTMYQRTPLPRWPRLPSFEFAAVPTVRSNTIAAVTLYPRTTPAIGSQRNNGLPVDRWELQ